MNRLIWLINTVLPKNIYFLQENFKESYQSYQNQYLNINTVNNEPLFCIKEYTNIKGSNWLSFSFKIINTNIRQHNGRPFGDYVVLFNVDFIDF